LAARSTFKSEAKGKGKGKNLAHTIWQQIAGETTMKILTASAHKHEFGRD